MRKTSLALSMLLGATLVLSGCGDRDTATATRNLRAEIVAYSPMAGATSVTDEQADCLADGMVARIGVQRLQDYDVLTDDLKVNQGIENLTMNTADALRLADVFLDCVDVQELFAKQLSAGSTATALSAPQQDCVGGAVTEEVVRSILVAGFRGQKNDAYARLQDQVVQCAVGSNGGKAG